MTGTIQIPSKGDGLKAAWGASVANGLNALMPMAPARMLVREGVGGVGCEPLPQNLRDRKSKDLHPWKVFASVKSEEVSHCFEIYVPEGSVHVGEDMIEVEGLTPVEGKTERYTLDCEQDLSQSAILYLAVFKDNPDDLSHDGEDERPEWKARIISSLESIDDEKEVLAVITIAKLSVDRSGEYDAGKVIAQYAWASVAYGEPGAAIDEISIGTVTAEDAEDPSAIQVKDFDNDRSDGSQGLAQRLRVVKDGEGSYHLEADGDGVFVLARVNGKIKYIPLSGKDEKDPDEEAGERPDECEHPGGGGGVPADGTDAGHGVPGGGGGGGAAEGGVEANGDTHAGDGCNCD